MRYFIYCIIALFLICWTIARPQKSHNFITNLGIEPKLHYGAVLPFYEAIEYLVHDWVSAFEIKIAKPSTGNSYWEKLYRFPRTGICYSYWNLGNPEVFGKAHALYAFINIPIYKKNEFFSFNYQVSFGFSYLTKKFNVYENQLNRAIGSHGNVYFRLGFDSKIKLFKKSEIVLETGFSHFSNGKIKSPNYGLNALTASIGLNYFINNVKYNNEEIEIPQLEKHYQHTIIYSAGTKVYDNLFGIHYFVSSVSYSFEKLLNHKRRIGLGADVFYDESIREALADKGEYNNDSKNLFRMGIHLSHSLRYKRVLLCIHVGYYLYSKYTDISLLYNRLAFQYMISNNIIVNISLKSHMAKADFIEWGIGYTW